MDTHITATMEDTRRKLLENFDAEVHDRLKINMTKARSISTATRGCSGRSRSTNWAKHAKFDDDYLTFMLKSAPEGIEAPAGSYYMSQHGIDGHRYRLGHPLAQHILSAAGSRKLNGAQHRFRLHGLAQTAVAMEPLVGKAGTLVAHKLCMSRRRRSGSHYSRGHDGRRRPPRSEGCYASVRASRAQERCTPIFACPMLLRQTVKTAAQGYSGRDGSPAIRVVRRGDGQARQLG